MKTHNNASIITKAVVVLLLIAGFLSCGTPKSNLNTKKLSKHQSDSIKLMTSRKAAALFSDGLAQRLSGNDQKAIENFQMVLEVDPNEHAAMYELSELYVRKMMIEEAVALMEKAVQLDPKNEWYSVRLAQLYEFTGNNQGYADIYKKLLEMQPDRLEYYSELSNALVILGQYKEALEIFDKIEQQIGSNEMLTMQKYSIYIKQNNYKAALTELEKLSHVLPGETKYHAMLAEMYMQHGPKEKALEHYKKILETDPSDPYIHISLAEYYREVGQEEEAFNSLLKAFENPKLDVETKVQVMVLWFDKKLFSEELNQQAEEIGNMFAKIHPDSPRGYQLLADVHMRRDEFEKARDNFLKAVELDANNYLVWESLLFTDIQLLDFDALVTHAQETILLFPEQPLAYYFRGIALARKNEASEALAVLERGRKFVVGNDKLLGEFFSTIGEVQHQLGNHAASDDAYNKALIINPANSIVLNNYAYYLSLRSENLEKALEMSAQSIEYDPGNASNLDTYAWVLYKMNDFENALEWIKKAVEASETVSGTLWEHYGDILFKLGNKTEAVEKWKQAADAGEASEFIDAKIKDGKLYE